MTKTPALLIWLTGVLFACNSLAQTITLNSGNEKVQDITTLVEVGQSPGDSSDLDLHKIIFRKNIQADLKKDYSSQDLWLKFTLKNESAEAQTRWLYFSSPLVGELTLFPKEDFTVKAHTGPGLPLNLRSPPTRLGTFEVTLNPGEEFQYYLRQKSHHALNSKLYLAKPEVAQAEENQARAIFFFYLGGIFSLVIYNFALGLFSGQKDYLIYSLFAASFATTAMTIHGVIDTYLLPNGPFVFSRYLMFFSSLSLISAALFVRRFLNIGKDFVVAFWGLRTVMLMALVALIASFFAPHNENLYFFGYWIDLWITLGIIFFLYCGIYSVIKRNVALAYFFMLSWLVVLVGTGVWFASLHGVIESGPFTQYSLLLANLGEMLVLSLGLAYKIKTLDQEKQVAVAAAVEKERYHRLVKVLSHDVANALSTLLFQAGRLTELKLSGVAEDASTRIMKTAQRLENLLKGVREEELLHSFKARPELQTVDVLQACSEAARHFSWELNDKRIELHLNVAPGIFIKADRSALINQVLANLLSNAIKFSESDCSINMTASTDSKEVRLAIQDQGTGIPAEYRGSLFTGEKLFSERGTANERGTGLGSVLVGEYMRLFNSRIEVQSTHFSEGRPSGTTISLIFPRP